MVSSMTLAKAPKKSPQALCSSSNLSAIFTEVNAQAFVASFAGADSSCTGPSRSSCSAVALRRRAAIHWSKHSVAIP